MLWTCEFSKRRFACNARCLFCKDGAIFAKNSPNRTSHGVARAIVKGTSLRSPSPITAHGFCTIKHNFSHGRNGERIDMINGKFAKYSCSQDKCDHCSCAQNKTQCSHAPKDHSIPLLVVRSNRPTIPRSSQEGAPGMGQ